MQTECMVPPRAAFVLKNVVRDALPDALLQHTRSHACSSVRSVVPSACVCLLAHMETNNIAHATTTGRPREEGPNALRLLFPLFHCPTVYVSFILLCNQSASWFLPFIRPMMLRRRRKRKRANDDTCGSISF
ncbi:Uncharacterized protein TCM_040807 [Theobroma cacao]|uniref:Uncharacterized protein n=1 Tax=Theobroma cacao TaxID=3641 RepID=A0A061GUF5_THECC|nr:Uncharacterized protein TCM_040807 [Theobroma cacao]